MFHGPQFLENPNIQSNQKGIGNDSHDKKVDPNNVNMNIQVMHAHGRGDNMSAVAVFILIHL